MAEEIAKALDINLLRGKRKRDRHKRMVLARVQVIAVSVLAVYIAVLVIISVVKTGLDLQLKGVEDKIDDETFALSQLKPVETLYDLTVNKFELFDEAEEGRIVADATIDTLAAQLPPGVEIRNLSFSDKEQIEVTVNAKSVREAVSMLDALEEEVFAGSYKAVGVARLSRLETGEYTLNIIYGGLTEENGS